MTDILWRGILIGIGGTVFMDVWAVILWKVFGQPKPNWGPGGRWFWHVFQGKVFLESIATAQPYRNEHSLGWAGHYAVGILYGVVFGLIAGAGWFATPTFIPVWVFSIITIAAGWFLMQPGMGLGWAASKTPKPNKVRVLGLIAHTVFALGLYVTALLIR